MEIPSDDSELPHEEIRRCPPKIPAGLDPEPPKVTCHLLTDSAEGSDRNPIKEGRDILLSDPDKPIRLLQVACQFCDEFVGSDPDGAGEPKSSPDPSLDGLGERFHPTKAEMGLRHI